MYQSGDMVVYGETGVCEVKGVESSETLGINNGMTYYVLDPINDSGVIYAPVGSGKVRIRPVLEREEAEKLIDTIPTIHAEAYSSTSVHKLANHYKEMIHHQDCEDLINMIMSIYAKKEDAENDNRKLGQIDKKFMNRAENLLYGEFAVSLGIEKKEVQPYIEKRVDDLINKR